MKKMMKTWALVAVAAMGLTACQNDFEEQIEAKDSVVVTLVADSADTRTSVDTTGEKPVFAWGENETFAVLEQTDALAAATSVTFTKEDGKAKIEAAFTPNEGKASYEYAAIYPAAGYVNGESLEAVTLSLPAVQTMAEGSYDPTADLMVSQVIATDAQPTEAQMVGFTRLAAVAKMSLKNFGIELGDEVESVTFTAEGKTLAGTFTANLAAPEVAGAEGSSSVTVNTTSASDIYFTLLPTTLEAGDAYTVTIITNNRLYIKQGTIPDEKSLVFEAGKVTRLGVNMLGVAPSDKWVLVKDASTLKQGDIVTIVAKDYDKAISKKLYSNGSETATNTRRDAVDITKYQNYLIANENVQPFVLVPGTTEGTFSFYDEAREKFLVSNNKTSRYLINQEYVSDDTSFAFTIDLESGDATIKNTVGDYTGNMIRYYNSSKYFYSGTSENQAVCVYKLDGSVGTIPVVAANVTVPDADESVVVAEEGATEATAIEEVVFNYVGDWTFTASSADEWLKVNYADGKLTYTADANTGVVRNTTVTITATLEGQEALTWNFNVLQKGSAQEISIAEFKTKSVDENVSYKITGRVTVASTTESGYYTLADENGNTAEVRYVYTDGGDILAKQGIVQVGDVMTVTTVVTTSKGKGGSSAYHSIYKGHYRLTATAEPAIVSYEGGDATISVALTKNGTLGTLCPPTAIEGTMTESDFATMAYITDATTATVSFEANAGASRKVEATFKSGLAEASVTIGQQNDPSVKVGWFLVTDVNELSIGDKVIIAAKNPDETLDYAISSKTSTSSSRPSVAISVTGESIDDVTGVQQYTLVSGHADYAGTWAFKGDSDSKYLYVSSGYLKVTSTLDNNGSWTIAVDSDGKATLTSKTTNSKNTMMLNYTTSNQTFNVYKPDQTGKGAIYIYKYYNSLEQ